FFFQAEDGIRDGHVTGVQTCALPISSTRCVGMVSRVAFPDLNTPSTLENVSLPSGANEDVAVGRRAMAASGSTAIRRPGNRPPVDRKSVEGKSVDHGGRGSSKKKKET